MDAEAELLAQLDTMGGGGGGGGAVPAGPSTAGPDVEGRVRALKQQAVRLKQQGKQVRPWFGVRVRGESALPGN